MVVPTLASTASKQLTAVYRDIKLVVDGIPVTPKDTVGNVVEPFVAEGTTYLPIRALADALGKTVEWDGATSTVYVGRKPGGVYYLPDFISPYSSGRYAEYSLLKSGGTKSFNMASVKYTDGMYFDCYGSSFAIYNLNGEYKSLKGLVGHIDGTLGKDTTMRVYADGILVEETTVSWEALPKQISIDLRGVLQLKITFDNAYANASGASYAIANPVLE